VFRGDFDIPPRFPVGEAEGIVAAHHALHEWQGGAKWRYPASGVRGRGRQDLGDADGERGAGKTRDSFGRDVHFSNECLWLWLLVLVLVLGE
jgi:hypothetical protein